ncbi:MAG: hypothetical protein KJ718_03125 [Nanoarchaeota archaeon]|nr:hypothetical protein [Nanoarchaeota archaeon]MBU1051522.1 hypothetical protein [Nanoarchaeota archaeon]MBU1988970.1 hypothetical protein [Nanoarchaeota archaeon]
MKKPIYIGILIFLMLVLLSYFVSAGFGDWIKGITGRATSGTEVVNLTVTGASAVTVVVYNATLSDGTPTENGPLGVTFTVQLRDTDGVDDIDDTSVGANFSKTGEELRLNTTCAAIWDENSTYTQNFTCNVTMWYFDAPGAWIINAWGNDTGNGTIIYNTTTTYDYEQLQAIIVGPDTLTWDTISPGLTNQTSNNDPTLINNTGNYNITNLTVTGVNLMGLTDNSYWIDVTNFTVDIETGGANPECHVNTTDVSGRTLLNETAREIIGALLDRGNNSINDGVTGQEQLYHCIPLVPTTSTQLYSTPQSWTIALI